MGVHEGNSESEDVASKILYATLLTTCSLSAPQYPQAEIYPYEPPVYAYQYAVSDPSVSGSVFSTQESRNDLEASGDYRVSLPDGRTQIVTYTISGPQGGYVANVQYDGEASYPDSPVKAAPLQAVVQPVIGPIAVSKPVFHSTPLAVAPSSYNPVVYSPVVRPSPYRPVVQASSYNASPFVFHSAPSPNRYTYTVKQKETKSVKEEREGKGALFVETLEPSTNSPVVKASPSPSTTRADTGKENQPSTTVIPVISTSEEATTPLPSTSSQIPILPEETSEVSSEDVSQPEDIQSTTSEILVEESTAKSQPQYYFRFL